MISLISDISEPNRLGLPINKNHKVFKTDNDVYFSATSHDKAISIHIAADRKNRKHIRSSVSEFCDYIFASYDCEVIVGAIKSQSVINLAKKCGFKYLTDCETNEGILPVYARFK